MTPTLKASNNEPQREECFQKMQSVFSGHLYKQYQFYKTQQIRIY